MRFARLLTGAGALAMGIVLTVSGCRSATTPVTFYTLSAVQSEEKPETSTLRDKVISIGPARFPDFLDRPQIVTREGVNRLQISEFYRWAGELDQNFLSILAENLSIRFSSPQVLIYSWKDQVTPDYRVALEIHQFEGQIGDAVILNVTWAIRGREEGSEPLIIRRSIIRRLVSGSDYDALVAAHSQAVGELSGEIAAAITALSKQ